MALNDDLLPPTPDPVSTGGSVFINNKSSYSGVDIKVVMHVYDGGKLTEQRKADLKTQIDNLNTNLQTLTSNKKNLQNKINTGSSFSTQDVDQFNSLNISVEKNQNLVNYLQAEITRLSRTQPKFSTKILAEVQTLSISTHREKFPVRSLGAVYPKGFTRGSRSIAGSMIFTVFDRHVIEEFLETHPADYDANHPSTTALIDQIPPFDITVMFANELGQISTMSIYGLEFINEGQTMSIEDLLLENVTQFVARDYDPMRLVSNRVIDENNRLTQNTVPVRGSSLLNDQNYQKYRDSLTPFDRFKIRNNPYT